MRRSLALSSSLIVGLACMGACKSSKPAEQATSTTAAPQPNGLDPQEMSCLRPATKNGCDEGVRATFTRPSLGSEWTSATISCDAGKPFARFASPAGEVQSELAQVGWDAFARTLDATGDCVSAYGAPLQVTRKGVGRQCADAKFDMRELLDQLYVLTRHGLPDAPKPGQPVGDSWNAGGLCAIDPGSCAKKQNDPCPPFRGDPWNGVTKPAVATNEVPVDAQTLRDDADGGAPDDSTAADRRHPSENEVRRVFATVTMQGRMCLGTEPSAKAVVTFQSDGTVASVAINGPAPGSPAERCIQRTLAGIKVAPFPEPTFAASIVLLKQGR